MFGLKIVKWSDYDDLIKERDVLVETNKNLDAKVAELNDMYKDALITVSRYEGTVADLVATINKLKDENIALKKGEPELLTDVAESPLTEDVKVVAKKSTKSAEKKTRRVVRRATQDINE